MDPILVVSQLEKVYDTGHRALKAVDLTIQRGEIFALLGPNGAGKTTLIGIVCGLVRPSGGSVVVDGHDIVRDFRAARAKIGLVPQEIATDIFSLVYPALRFSRGLFGLKHDPAHLEKVLRDLSLWERRDSKIVTLSGGMKRRLLIAKALAHEPKILFLDEPTAGVDVELRREMWAMVRRLRDGGVTIILTTHYIEEAEEMADRVGVIHKGEIVLVEEKRALMRQLGRTRVTIGLERPLAAVPSGLLAWSPTLSPDGLTLTASLSAERDEREATADFVKGLGTAGIDYRSIEVAHASLEDVFIHIVGGRA